MSEPYRITARAFHDLASLADFISNKVERGELVPAIASRFLDRVLEVCVNPYACESAPDPAAEGRDVRHAFFRTAGGRRHRFLFVVQHSIIHVLRVRGASQDLLRSPDELN